MNRINKSILTCIFIILACLNVLGQSILNVSGDGKLIDIMITDSSFPDLKYDVFLPVKKPNTKTITIKAYKLISTNGDLKRTGQSFTTTINYDSIGRIEKINEYTYSYDNNKIVGCKGMSCRWKYTYNNKGDLQKLNYYSPFGNESTYIYTLDDNKNVIKIDEYLGARHIYTHTCQFNIKGKKVFYEGKNKTDEYKKVVWSYNNSGLLTSIKTIKTVKQANFWDTETYINKFEYKLDYGKDGNPSRCIEYEIGDITIVKGGYEYEYSYTYYPTKEELKRQAEEKRIADSIWQVEQEELRKQQEVEQHRIDSLKNKYQSCRFLFDSRSYYVYCVTKKDQFATEMEIIQLVKKYIQNISDKATTGKELRNINTLGDDMINICNICRNLDDEEIVDHIERELEKFVSARKVLLKAYNKSSYTKYSEFLIDYINKTI